MTINRTAEYLTSLLHELCKLPHETEWLEFKHNNSNPHEIGEYLSALANAAARNGKANAYLVWGVEDTGHAIVGTVFRPAASKKGNVPLESWLLQQLSPKIHFHFHEIIAEDKAVVILEIERAVSQPVSFSGKEFIRVGPVKKLLKEAPERARELWRIFDTTPFEDLIAAEHLQAEDISQLLDYPAYFDLMGIPQPSTRDAALDVLVCDGVIRICEAGGWDITNLGAILFAKRVDDFSSLKRKAMRVIQYRGTGRVEAQREHVATAGYASGFEVLVDYINGVLPANEVIGQALRKTVPMFPELAVRELVANALIHQDFSVTGAGPMVEIFEGRIEITNPGEPLVDPLRFIDTPPKSRNEALASMMRRMNICEERGSGIDKVVSQIELFQLPAPLFEKTEGFTRSMLFSHKELKEMSQQDRIRACYLHACLQHVTQRKMTNSSLRERFGISDQNAAVASRILKEALEAGDIVIQDPTAGTRIRCYVPFWATPAGGRGGVV